MSTMTTDKDKTVAEKSEFTLSSTGGILLCIISAFLAVIVLIIVVLLCWKCWWRRRHSRRKSSLLPSQGCRHCQCQPRVSLSGHLGDGGHSLCSVQTVCDARHYCACQYNQQFSWPGIGHERGTPPPAYPIGHSSRAPGTNQTSEEAARIPDGLPIRPAHLSGPETRTQALSADPVTISPQQSPVRSENCLMGQRLLSRPSISSTFPAVLYNHHDRDSNLESSNSSNGSSRPDLVTGPMNIECPGLFETFPSVLREIFVPGQRSERRTVADKLMVSLARLVDSKGDFLVLDNMGISLQIPPNAIPAGQRQLVSLVLNWDLGDNPEMDNRQALVSPLVYCGPHGLKLQKPCVLSFKHCAFDARMIQVLTSQTELIEQKDWQVMCSAEDNSEAIALTTDECQVRLQHFSLFTCIQTPPAGSIGRKWLQVAAFCAPLQHQIHHYQIRVYFLNKTPCALQWAIQNEARFGFRLACPERTFLFHGTGENLHLNVGYVSRGWVAVRADHQGEEEDTALYHSIWHGKCPHLSICFKRSCLLEDQPRRLSTSPFGVTSDTSFPVQMQTHARELNLDLAVYQDSNSNSPDRLNILLTETAGNHQQFATTSSHGGFPDDPIPSCAPTHFLPTCKQHPISISMPPVPVTTGQILGKVRIDHQASGPNVMVDFEQNPDCLSWMLPKEMNEGEQESEVFPQELKLQLQLKLDPPCPFGKDWKLLASKVGLDKYIPWLMHNSNPTLHVLRFMETQKMTLRCLYFLLLEIERCDAASYVEAVINNPSRNKGKELSQIAHDGSAGPFHGLSAWKPKMTVHLSEDGQAAVMRPLGTRLDEGQEHSDSSDRK